MSKYGVFSGLYFSRIQSKNGNIRTRKNTIFGQFLRSVQKAKYFLKWALSKISSKTICDGWILSSRHFMLLMITFLFFISATLGVSCLPFNKTGNYTVKGELIVFQNSFYKICCFTSRISLMFKNNCCYGTPTDVFFWRCHLCENTFSHAKLERKHLGRHFFFIATPQKMLWKSLGEI